MKLVDFPLHDGPSGKKYHPGFSPGCLKPNSGEWVVNGKDNASENTLIENVLRVKFYIPNQKYTGLTADTNIECSSFVLRCTISAGVLDLNSSSITISKSEEPKIELRWDVTDLLERDTAVVTFRPLLMSEDEMAKLQSMK